MTKKFYAEMIGTMVLVLMGCGAAVFGTGGSAVAAWVLMVAFAFGLAVVAMAYTVGPISGCHINPAISLAAFITNRISAKECCYYMIAQVTGAFIGAGILYALVRTGAHTGGVTTTGANNFGEGMLLPAMIAETVFTFIFILVVLGATDSKNNATKFAGLAIGLALVLIHIVCIPITGTSVNPARSIAPAFFEGGTALTNLWVFILCPFLGATLAAFTWKCLNKECCTLKP
ncbi:MAG: MIP family channel protein [Bacteroidetes bacterium]|nr:MIP family channel protein [Bacteroidota bacterium]MCL2303503.1 MIP family channel protein [Lentimicrobiaceae bacterium]